eukprot:1693193-Heterocapsa_arctica.AAC.1
MRQRRGHAALFRYPPISVTPFAGLQAGTAAYSHRARQNERTCKSIRSKICALPSLHILLPQGRGPARSENIL